MKFVTLMCGLEKEGAMKSLLYRSILSAILFMIVISLALYGCGGGGGGGSGGEISVVADSTPPVITLLGANPVTVEAGTSYSDAGATASDNIDGDLTAHIIIDTSDVNVAIPDSYTVTYNVSDAAGNAATQVTRTVNVVPAAPQVNADTATTLIETPVAINVLANDTNADGNTLSIVQPANGTAVLNADGTITYTPNMGFYGPDNFTYSVSGAGGSSEAVVYVIVIGPQGTVSWVKHAGFFGRGIATLQDGTTFVTGTFLGSATFGAGEPNATTLLSAGSHDIFLAKYNPDGSLAFAKRAGGTGHPRNLDADTGLDIAVLPDGTSFVVGIYYGTAVFGIGEINETTLISAGQTDFFVARYNPNGTLAWVRSAGGLSDYEYARGVAILPDGSSLVTGEFEQTAIFEPGGPNETHLTVASGFNNIFIARYNSDGSLAWARKDGVTNSASGGNDIGVLPDGSIRVAGYFAGTATFGEGETTAVTVSSPPHPAGGYYSAGFVAAYDSDGAFEWVKGIG